nr:MAG TPA: hypothetical protein [Caudoviricetes sp.]
MPRNFFGKKRRRQSAVSQSLILKVTYLQCFY